MSARQRVDVWLYRARLARTRADAARLVGEGNVRLRRGEDVRRLEKPSSEVAPGDALLFAQHGRVRAVHVLGLGPRRGPAAEARALYRELDAAALA